MTAEGRGGPGGGKGHPGGYGAIPRTVGKLLSAARCQACIEHVTTRLGTSERLPCQVLGQHRSMQCKAPSRPTTKRRCAKKSLLRPSCMAGMATAGVTALLRTAGWCTNHKLAWAQ